MAGTVDLEAIGIFVEVATLASFRGAADALGVPRSTVSRRVSELERQLGVRLLQRTTRKVTLTDAGAAYWKECQPALEALGDAARVVTAHASEARGRLRITAAVTFGERFLAPLVAEYLEANPEVTIDVVLVDRLVDLVQEGFDLAFRAGRVGDPSLVAREVGRARLRCFASASYLRRRGTPRRPRDVEDHDCIVYGPLAAGGRWPFRVNGRTVEVPARGRITVNSLPLAIDAAVGGFGLVRLPGNAAVDDLARGKLTEVLAPYAPLPNPIFIVHPSGARAPPRVRAFVELAVERLSVSLAPP